MLNGLDPIIIFAFKKLIADLRELTNTNDPPLVPDTTEPVPVALIPVYLSERLTGLYIDSESKNIDIDTEITTLPSGGFPEVNQKGLSSTITIQMRGSANSIGLSILIALSDVILSKVTSNEYSITYIHGAITVFEGRINKFSVVQGDNDDMYRITLELVKGGKSGAAAKASNVVDPVSDTQMLSDSATAGAVG